MKYPKLFEPGRIGKVEIRNRVVVTAMMTGIAQENGDITQEYIDYVTERAKGGLGLFITEIILVDEVYGRALSRQNCASRLAHISPWRKLADSVHQHGGKIFAQLWHPGRQTNSMFNEGRQTISSSNTPGIKYPEEPRAMTKEEIKELVGKFATAAKIVQTAGVDGVELHGAHTYLIHQFISELVNRRTDEYGGSFENRMRFVQEIVAGIREACGPDFPISVRISATENFPGGYELDEGVRIAKYLDEVIGVDAINVSNGIAESSYMIQEPPTFEQGWKINNAREIKKHVKVPVIAVSAIREPAFAENLLQEGAVDFIGNTRGHLADPDWCNKARYGEDIDIRKCIQCLYCFQEMFSMKEIRCAINPVAGREASLGKLDQVGNGRTVAVVGAGPAGLEAAKILGKRGFKPVVFEQSNQYGGALQLANKPLHKERIDWLIDTMVYQAKKAGATIHLNTPAGIADLKAMDPYAVVVATGCKPLEIRIPGDDAANVYSVVDYLEGNTPVFEGMKIAVIGGGTTGLETAEKLSIEGNNAVTVVEMLPEVGKDMYAMPKADFMERLENLKVELLTNAKVQEITQSGITYEDLKENQTKNREFDAVILSLGFQPETKMVQEIKDAFGRVRVIGDAVKVRKISDAIFEGYAAGFTLE